MDDLKKIERLWELHDQLVGKKSVNINRAEGLPPFDITKGNFHDKKADFLAEREAVAKAISALDSLIRFFAPRYKEDDPMHAVSSTVMDFLDANARSGRANRPTESATELVRRSAIDANLTDSSLYILLELMTGLIGRNRQLDEQEVTYWNTHGRSPNHYARTIALRLAKVYARAHHRRPTYGTSSEGGHPSTVYGRVLEEVYGLLGIEANIRNNAKFAAENLTDDDLAYEPINALLKYGVAGDLPAVQRRDPTQAIVDALMKKDKG